MFFFVVRPLNTLMARLRPEPAVDQVVRPCPECLSDIPRGGAAVRVLHRGGPGCLTSSGCAPRRRTRSRCRAQLRESAGGAVAAPRDLLLMAAGFEAPGVNSGDVTGPDPDLEAARAFYAAHGVSWGLRVPPELPWRARRGCCSAAA